MKSNSKIQLGILGENISYTKSPLLHNLISKQKNINLDYKIFDVSESEFEKFIINQLREINGFNITIPYKESVIPYLHYIEQTAEKIRAVNTVKVKNNKFYGYNTDIIGFIKTIKLHILNYKKYFPVLIGYGGVSKAVIFGLEELGFSNCAVIGGLDNSERKEMINNISPKLKIKITENIPTNLPILWINATPIGTNNFPKISDNFIKIRKNDFLFDLNYSPNPTHLQKWFINSHSPVRAGKAVKLQRNDNKIKSVNGIYMLIYQGIASEEIWFPNINFVNLNIENIVEEIYKN
ncbi:MAG: hypothetical protein U9R41_06135 [Candidatus Marinimicrobia bacterium]|nr:hypothetical protein [Candidatus Neomarinimicrobiota bacterium]